MNGVYCKDCRRFDRDLQCCKVTSESKAGAKERECNQFRKRFISNGDRIRAMSNEELAHFIDKRTGCPPENGAWRCAPENCRQCWFDWLNKEATGEENATEEA